MPSNGFGTGTDNGEPSAHMDHAFETAGFIGLGVMGEPICRNLALKSRLKVIAFDIDPSPLERLREAGVLPCRTAGAAVGSSDVVFLSLPSGEIVRELARAKDGLLATVRPDQVVVDLGTSPVELTRELAHDFARRGALFIDAPVARTRAAAEAGTLSVMVGATASAFDRVRPLIATFASEITHCGPVGCGQVVKILNNMILFQIGVAISEAKAIGERSGVDLALLFDTLAKGSADSFALRNHGVKAILPGDFPLRSFSVEYARKDLRYALSLAATTRVESRNAHHVDELFARAIASGLGDRYWPVVSQLIERT
jgi:3-hydroxyisobutyrate dehydrogenase-like beta-hydroxyacid dehydrogenase